MVDPIKRTPVEDNTSNNVIPSSYNNSMEEVFGRFDEIYKQYDESKEFDEWDDIHIIFEASLLQIDDTSDIEIIIQELNSISSKIFMFGYIYESQQKVVQKLEDDFESWLATVYVIVDSTPVETKKGLTVKAAKRTETSKEKIIRAAYQEEYDSYTSKLRDQKFKLGLVKRVLNSLENYSYKLHSILNYRQMAVQKGL